MTRAQVTRLQDLRRRGLTFDEIAALEGMPVEEIRPLIKQAVQELVDGVESLTVEKALELSRLDAMLQTAFMSSTDAKLPLGERTKAQELVLKIMERRSRLRGMDAPTRTLTAGLLATMSDEELLSEAQKLGIEIAPLRAITGPNVTGDA